MNIKPTVIALAFAMQVTALVTPALAHDYTVGSIMIGHPISRATPAAAPVAAGYLTLKNTGSEADTLVSGSSPIAEGFEVHESTIIDGVARMRRLDGGIVINPGETVTLKPGGSHIMFLKPKQKLVEGEKFPVTLRFSRGGEITVDFAVQGLGGAKPAASGHNDHMPKAN
jgi:hypothetical protein